MSFDNITKECMHACMPAHTHTNISMDRTKALRCWLDREREIEDDREETRRRAEELDGIIVFVGV